jgi:hypothetical protein
MVEEILAQRRRGAGSVWQAVLPGVLALIVLAGLALGWDKGQLPRRKQPAIPVAEAASATAPDLALYREMILSVRGGANYYAAAREAIPRYGFPIASPLNWRLPTYAWLFARLPNQCWIQAVLLVLAVGGMWLAFVAESRRSSVGQAGVTLFLLFGVIRWTFDGEAYLAQEVWAAVLLVISLSAHALAAGWDKSAPAAAGPPIAKSFSWWAGARSARWSHSTRRASWRCLAVVAGLLALFFRELAMPYCGIACLIAVWNRRWVEAAAWAAGIVLFLGFFAWHIGQVRMQLAGTEVVAAAGLSQWLRFGSLDFVLLTTRMNSLLFAAPACLLWLYLLTALLGLSQRRDETSQLACLTALAYLVTFAFVGRPENFYWGLMAAPLLPWGIAHAPRAIRELWTTTALGSVGAVANQPAR